MYNRNRQDMKIYVEELVIAESGSYSDQFLRPYVSEVNGGLIDTIEERFAKTRRFTPSLLANIAHQFMVPDFKPRGVIDIPHGWGERRGRFVLTLDIRVGTGARLKQIVMGYTNSVGFTLNSVDPEMEFYVNSTYMMTKQDVPNERGGYSEVWVPKNVNDIISDRDNAGLRRRGPELYTIRPEDIFSSLDAEQTNSLVDDVTDLRTTLSKQATKSNSSNRLGATYMARVLDSRQKALANNDYANAALELNASAQGYVQEGYASDDIFLRTISGIRGSNTIVDTFLFRDLLSIDDTAEDRTDTMLFHPDERGSTRFGEFSNPMDGQEEEDRIAALIAMAVPALMMECGIHGLDFQVHNQSGRPGTDDHFAFSPSNSGALLKGMDLTTFMYRFEDRLVDELLMPITQGGMLDIGIQATCRIFGEIDFTLFWDGRDRGRFVTPTFCNSLSSPIVTDNRNDVKKLAKDFNDLFDTFLPDKFIPTDRNGSGGW